MSKRVSGTVFLSGIDQMRSQLKEVLRRSAHKHKRDGITEEIICSELNSSFNEELRKAAAAPKSGQRATLVLMAQFAIIGLASLAEEMGMFDVDNQQEEH